MSRHKEPKRTGMSPSRSVIVRNVPQPDGRTLMQMEIRTADLEVPDREYFADTASVYAQDNTARLAFAQCSPKGVLRSLVVLVLTPDAARLFLANCGSFMDELDHYLGRIGLPPRILPPPFEQDLPQQQSACMLANIVAANQVGTEGTLDFYRLPAAELRRAAERDGSPRIEPIVRITLMTDLMYSIIRALQKLAPPSERAEVL